MFGRLRFRPLQGRSRGQIMVMVALGFPTFLAFIGLGVDGGLWLGRHQAVKAAADMAALEGAYCMMYPTKTHCTNASGFPGSGSNAIKVAKATAKAEGYENAVNSATVNVTNPTSSRIRVEVSQPASTYFVKLVGVSSLTATGTAEAATAILNLTGANAPLVACGNAMIKTAAGNPPPNFDILLGNGTSTIDPSDPSNTGPYRIDSSYFGQDFVLQSSQMDQSTPDASCPHDNGDSFKGKLQPGAVIDSFPDDVPTDNGNADADIPSACTASGQPAPTSSAATTQCALWLPVAIGGAPNGYARVVTAACFKMYDGGNGTEKWRGVLLDPDASGNTCNYGNFGEGAPPSGSTVPGRVQLAL